MKHLLLVVGFCFIASIAGLKCSQFEEAYLAVDHLISENITIIPTLVRLAFHDCLGEYCDGCLNLKIRTNFGLEAVTVPLNEIYEEQGFYKMMSRADFWQVAGHVALVRGGLNQDCHSSHDDCPFFHNQFHWGREDCPSSPNYHGYEDGGDANGDFDEVYRLLHGDFGFSVEEIVTILGAHSLGGADRSNSGFIQNWQKNQLTFDNQYYENMVNLPYSHIDVAQGHNPKPRKEFLLKDAHPTIMMLNTDMALWKDLKATKEDGKYTGNVKCPIKGDMELIPDEEPNFHDMCKNAETAHQVEHYAHDVQSFFDDFPSAYQKMVSNGYKHLSRPFDEHHEVCGYCIPKGAYCERGFRLSGSCCDDLHCQNNRCVH